MALCSRYFYPRSPCGERPKRIETELCNYTISIHALLAESDFRLEILKMPIIPFLSTLSLRRATKGLTAPAKAARHFYPRSPCGERRSSIFWTMEKFINISIHALLAESDRRQPALPEKSYWYFYPRSPCGERRCGPSPRSIRHNISIHALLAESDERIE